MDKVFDLLNNVYYTYSTACVLSLTNWGKQPSENLTSDANVDYAMEAAVVVHRVVSTLKVA